MSFRCLVKSIGMKTRWAPFSEPGKNVSILLEVCRSIFDDNITKGTFQKVGTTPLIEKALKQLGDSALAARGGEPSPNPPPLKWGASAPKLLLNVGL